MVALLYPAVKLLAYGFWCYLGLRTFRPSMNGVYSRSLLYGFFRLFMGLFFGVAIWMLSSVVLSHIGYGLPQNVLTYLLVYVPVDRVVHHGGVDRSGFISFASMDLRNFAR
jgi:hypothetical protein